MISRHQLEQIIEAGILAPSVDNCQPWVFTIDGNSINIFLDKARAEFFGNYNHTASYVTMGAVIENMAIAASQFGLNINIITFPEDADSLVATIRFFEGEKKDIPLFHYIKERCTNRRKYDRRPLSKGAAEEIVNTPRPEGANLYLIEDREKINEISSLASLIDRTIFEHRLLHSGLFKWIRWDKDDILKTMDGIPVGSIELNFINRIFFRIISSWPVINFLNKFGLSRVIGKVNSILLKNASAVGMIVMDNSTKNDYLNGGRFFERIWLKAASLGLALQPVGGITFLITRILQAKDEGFSKNHYERLLSVYSRLCKTFPIKEGNALIIFFRVGYADKPSARALRRPLSEALYA
jgi:nitroreductase